MNAILRNGLLLAVISLGCFALASQAQAAPSHGSHGAHGGGHGSHGNQGLQLGLSIANQALHMIHSGSHRPAIYYYPPVPRPCSQQYYPPYNPHRPHGYNPPYRPYGHFPHR